MARHKTRIRKKYEWLEKNHRELCECYSGCAEDSRRYYLEMRYLRDFIRYKGLEDEYHYFREHAHEDTESELPFPDFVL